MIGTSVMKELNVLRNSLFSNICLFQSETIDPTMFTWRLPWEEFLIIWR